jgi:hypothetical protein
MPATIPVETRQIVLRTNDTDALDDVTSEAGIRAKTLAQLPTPPAKSKEI